MNAARDTATRTLFDAIEAALKAGFTAAGVLYAVSKYIERRRELERAGKL